MEDETLTNILNILQNTSSTNHNNSANNNHNNNNDLQNLLIKMLLSGGLNHLFTPKPNTPDPQTPPRTINLENYQRID